MEFAAGHLLGCAEPNIVKPIHVRLYIEWMAETDKEIVKLLGRDVADHRWFNRSTRARLEMGDIRCLQAAEVPREPPRLHGDNLVSFLS